MFKISELMGSAWGKENPESGRIVRFVSFEYFYSGQFVHNFSISRPSYLLCFIHLIESEGMPGRGIHCCGTSLGSLATSGAVGRALPSVPHTCVTPCFPVHCFPAVKENRAQISIPRCFPFRQNQQKKRVIL